MKVERMPNYGYCFGTKHALELCSKAREENPISSIYLLGELVHNYNTNDYLAKDLGIQIIRFDVDKRFKDLDVGSVVIFPAHGHKKSYDLIASKRNYIVYDAICPQLVKIQEKIKKDLKAKKDIIYIGKTNHPEVNAMLELSKKITFIPFYNFELPNKEFVEPVLYSQSTLDSDIFEMHKTLKATIPNLKIETTLCQVNMERQKDMRSYNPDAFDMVFVIGDERSSNTVALLETAIEHFNKKTRVINVTATFDVTKLDLRNVKKVLIGTGASSNAIEVDFLESRLQAMAK